MFRQQLTPDTRVGWRGFIVAGLIAAWIGITVSIIQPKPLEPAVAAQVATNQEVFAACNIAKKCLGGFVKFKDSRIILLDNCGRNCYGRYVWNLSDIQTLFLSGSNSIQNVDAVILPDNPAWPATAVEHARQLVEK